MGAHGGLATGQADGREAVALDEQPRDAFDLLEREDVVSGQPLHALGWHAIRAAQVAAIGDGDAQVAVDATEAVGERAGHDGQVRGMTSTSSPSPAPSPSARTASALALASAAS